jgi:hypothetical protein
MVVYFFLKAIGIPKTKNASFTREILLYIGNEINHSPESMKIKQILVINFAN